MPVRCTHQGGVRTVDGGLAVSRSPFYLEFNSRHLYEQHEEVSVPISLSASSSLSAGILANVDTGSTFCIFERVYADILGLDLASGVKQRIATATGSFYCFGHELTMSVFDLEWQAFVYFAEPESFNLNVVGRLGFLDRLKIGIVDYQKHLYLGVYE